MSLRPRALAAAALLLAGLPGCVFLVDSDVKLPAGSSGSSGTSGSCVGADQGPCDGGSVVFPASDFAASWTVSNFTGACPGNGALSAAGGASTLEVDLSCDFNQGAILSAEHADLNFELVQWPRLELDLLFPGDAGADGLLFAPLSGGVTGAHQPLGDFLSDAGAGPWVHASIPLAGLTCPATDIDGFKVWYSKGSPGPVFYLGQIQLVGACAQPRPLDGGATSGSGSGSTAASSSGAASGSTGAAGSSSGSSTAGATSGSTGAATSSGSSGGSSGSGSSSGG